MLLLIIVIVVIVIVIACKLAGVGGKAASIPIPTLQVELTPPCHIAVQQSICLLPCQMLTLVCRDRPETTADDVHPVVGALEQKPSVTVDIGPLEGRHATAMSTAAADKVVHLVQGSTSPPPPPPVAGRRLLKLVKMEQ